ncbi:HDOD domain-containing protein [Thalassotalea euphylliae]|uniref:HDOD domain-containing protein n=1 Tax=Thalassotalea euphylliae TaxID=1655234 RepID=UPI002162AD92|nr:HDOD domain-containing protein [Thalassotalea euphylliae]
MTKQLPNDFIRLQAIDYANQANGSFALPDACFKVKTLMEDEHSTATDFGNIISVDPSMTSRLLKIANSAVYSFSGEISTISRAITVIGTQSIYNMMLVDVASSAFKHFANQAIDLKRFWRTSVYCGLAAKNLAISAGIRDIERLFVAGLLQNFGELIVAKVSPEIAQHCEQYSQDDLPWQRQYQALDFTYTDVSAELLKLWQIPEKIILPIRHFNQALDIQINKDVKVMYLASRLALVDSHPELFTYDDIVDQGLCQSLGITFEELIAAAEFAHDEADNVLSIMGAKFFDKPSG